MTSLKSDYMDGWFSDPTINGSRLSDQLWSNLDGEVMRDLRTPLVEDDLYGALGPDLIDDWSKLNE